jgi:hypothetical protein
MSLAIIDDGKKIKIPKHVRAEGIEAIEKFLAEQRKANEVLRKPAPKPKKKEQEEE